MKTLHFDLVCGAAGDMILSSLIDLGFPVEYLNEQLRKLNIEQITVHADRVTRNGIQCTQIRPEWGHAHEYRHMSDILEIINRGEFPERVRKRCESVLDRLATAEASVHGVPKDHVHFHEIGAIDTIIDVLGVSLALEYLEIEKMYFSTITVGYGTITTAHGVIPVPVPASAAMIEGFNVQRLDIPTEILTPTGAAILTALGEQVPSFSGTIEKSGYGCGTKVFENHPNLIRALLLQSEQGSRISDSVCVIETDMDHITGEIMGNVSGRVLEMGALDAVWIPVYMKKGRPGYRLSVLAREELCSSLVDFIIINTRTLGVRVMRTDRIIAHRETRSVNFSGESVPEKRCSYMGHTFSKLEYETLDRLSREEGVPVIELVERYIRNSA